MFVVAGLHIAAQLVGGFEELGLEAEVAAVVLVFAVGHVSFLLFLVSMWRGAGQSSTTRNSVVSASGRTARVSGLRCSLTKP